MAYKLKGNQRSVKILEDYGFNVCGFQIKEHFIIWSWGAVYIQLLKTNNSKMGCLKLDPVLMLFFEIYSLVEDCVQKQTVIKEVWSELIYALLLLMGYKYFWGKFIVSHSSLCPFPLSLTPLLWLTHLNTCASIHIKEHIDQRTHQFSSLGFANET